MDTPDRDQLSDALAAHIAARGGEPAREVTAFCCAVLRWDPAVPWLDAPPPVRAGAVPEGAVCSAWHGLFTGDIPAASATTMFETGAATPHLWPPVAALACRGLAWNGRRSAIHEAVTAAGGPLDLYRAEALMEAALTQPLPAGWLSGIPGMPAGVLPEPVPGALRRLIEAELALATGEPDGVDELLAGLLDFGTQHEPGSYAHLESRRIEARAAAALARARIAQGRDQWQALDCGGWVDVPAWERQYVRALIQWQSGEIDAAATSLETAFQDAPSQTPVRLALVTLLAERWPERALELTLADDVTREVLVARATLLARRRQYGAARQALESAAGAGLEPLRYVWRRGREQSQRQEHALRAALFEYEGNWPAAARESAEARVRKTLGQSRQLYALRREFDATPPARSWRRSDLAFRIDRLAHDLRSVPLPATALFFRAVALAGREPERALKDLETLIRRRAWVDRERTTGAGRLVAAGDALAATGAFDSATRAYEAAGASERAAITSLCAAIARGAGADEVRAAMDQTGPEPWPVLAGAAGLLAAGDSSGALAALDAAGRAGAPAEICGAMRAILTRESLPETEIAALGLPPDAAAAVRLLCGDSPEPERIARFVESGADWPERCPVDPAAMSARLMDWLCSEGKWDEALAFASQLERLAATWAIELAALVRLRCALKRALAGEIAEAEEEIRRIEEHVAAQTAGRD